MLGLQNLPQCAIDGCHTSKPLRFCELHVVIHWQKNIEGLGMMLAMVRGRTGSRSVGRLISLIDMTVWWRWQFHNNGIAGGVDE